MIPFPGYLDFVWHLHCSQDVFIMFASALGLTLKLMWGTISLSLKIFLWAGIRAVLGTLCWSQSVGWQTLRFSGLLLWCRRQLLNKSELACPVHRALQVAGPLDIECMTTSRSMLLEARKQVTSGEPQLIICYNGLQIPWPSFHAHEHTAFWLIAGTMQCTGKLWARAHGLHQVDWDMLTLLLMLKIMVWRRSLKMKTRPWIYLLHCKTEREKTTRQISGYHDVQLFW